MISTPKNQFEAAAWQLQDAYQHLHSAEKFTGQNVLETYQSLYLIDRTQTCDKQALHAVLLIATIPIFRKDALAIVKNIFFKQKMPLIQVFDEVYETYAQTVGLRCDFLYRPLYTVLCKTMYVYISQVGDKREYVYQKMRELSKFANELDGSRIE